MSDQSEDITMLQSKAKEIRRSIIKMLCKAGSGHPGGSLSACDIAVALYYKEMKVDPKNPKMENRDRFVMSKGHAAPLQYAILADQGFFPKEELDSLRKLGGMLQGHPSVKTPGIEAATGALGQGLSVANGMALASKLDNADWRVYCIMGDGEIQEGNVWEAAMTSTRFKLDNLVAFIDSNNLQIDGKVSEVKSVEPLADKWRAFNWNVLEIDGHNIGQILDALSQARNTKGKPTMIIAKTIKGKGVSYMENQVDFHGCTPNNEQEQIAMKELM